jgi:hypothetical protein
MDTYEVQNEVKTQYDVRELTINELNAVGGGAGGPFGTRHRPHSNPLNLSGDIDMSYFTRETKAGTARPHTRYTHRTSVGWREGLIATTTMAFCGLLAGTAAAQSDQLGPSTPDSHSVAPTVSPDAADLAHAQWRDSIIKTKTPSEGCFESTFPSTQWESVPCREVSLHAHPIPRQVRSGEPQTVGSGEDYALVASGLISQTVGSFPAVSGILSESGVGVPAYGDGGILGANEYTLQLNTNSNSRTNACSGGSSECTVWQQFIYATDYETKGSAAVFMQYWLLDYGASGAACPSGWGGYEGSCYKNSSYVVAPDVAPTGLGNLKLTGTVVRGGNDTITFANGTTAYSVSAPDSVVDIATVWDQSEFNVVGNGGGSEAEFNPGTEITVNVAAQYGSDVAPACPSNGGTTGETNNLYLSPSCITLGGGTPSIRFTESLTFDQPAVAITGEAYTYLFWMGSDANLWQASGSATGSLGTPIKLGMGPLGSNPAVGVDATGATYAYWEGTDGNLYEAYWNGSAWVGPYNRGMGPLNSPPTVAITAAGEAYVFWKGTDNNLYEAQGPAKGQLSGPYNRGMGPLGSAPAVGVDAKGLTYVYWEGTDRNLYEGYWNGSAWVGPYNREMGPLNSPPAAAVSSNANAYVFWEGTDGNLYEAQGAANGPLSGPYNRGYGPFWGTGALGSAPTAGIDANGATYVYWGGSDYAFWEAYWDGSAWVGPYSRGQ